MKTKAVSPPFASRAIWSAGLLILLFAVLNFTLPASQETINAYGLESWQYRVLRLSVSLPVLLVWVAAFVGYASLRQYAQAISRTKEGYYFDKLATGAKWLAWSLPLSALAWLTLNSMGNMQSGFEPAAVIIRNYINLLLPLIAFSVIGSATRGLVSQANLRLSLTNVRIIMLLYLAAGVTYCLLVFQHFSTLSLGSTDNPYHLPVWLVVLTVIIPYLYTWFVGLLAAYEISLFSTRVSGVLYRQALRLLAIGFIAVIASSIALQYLSGLPTPDYLVFDYRLMLVLLFRIIGGIGFVLLTWGAFRLKKIEEV